MNQIELRETIENAVKNFAGENIFNASVNLFNVLGYNTSLQSPLDEKTFDEFNNLFIESSPNKERFSKERAFADEWKSIDIIFQLTDESFSQEGALFDSTLDPKNPQSYLCFALELKKDEYTKSSLAAITREVNKIFTIPIIIVFRYGKNLTLSVINRRLNKKDSERDVLEKVTLIKDINIQNPHRAHIDILCDMSLSNLNEKFTVTDFKSLHKAWEEILDTQTLNKRFYNELSNWYFWAIKEVVFPGYQMEAEQNSLFTKEDKVREHNAKNLIRLLTRLLFVWFIKEKDLIPEEFFDEKKITNIITNFNPEYNKKNKKENPENASIYYKAILQNLFFASLNAEQGKRAFRIDGQNQNATSLMRYKRYHKNPDEFVKFIESKVPFMNGGLFECLDHQDDELKGKKGGALIDYEDGFSDRKDNELFVPDCIFFGNNIKADLSAEYDDKKKKDAVVNGIVNILKKYKFTIAENTPVEEDIALDPELLGRVFENLLASYNPETKTNARKQTGSFYTPRPIVEYMVDESLKAYLTEKISSNKATDEKFLDQKLSNLIAYNEAEPDFTEEERFTLLCFLDECKILDPACGSGAFPMGILQKMAYIIHKLDPQNENWKQIQIQKISNDKSLTPKEKNEMQKELLTVFDDNELDYARKLYLIENCIYGIDIQPIATQISRLRFFISLIVDQTVDSKKPNFGVRPLPNLENKFVTANSLVGLNEESATLYGAQIEPLMERLQKVRHNLFNARSPKYKMELKIQDKQIRKELEQTLINLGFGSENAKLLSTWDPYDKNKSAPFFDSEWMFGVQAGNEQNADNRPNERNGFDIVIGNPPYKIVAKEDRLKEIYDKNFEVAHGGKRNLYHLFFEKGIKLLHSNGILSFITPDTYFSGNDTEYLRKYFVDNTKIESIVHYTEKDKVFENVTQAVAVIVLQKKNANKNRFFTIQEHDKQYTIFYKNLNEQNKFIFKSDDAVITKMKQSTETFGSVCEGYKGDVNLGLKKDFFTDEKTNNDLPLIRGVQLSKYNWEQGNEYCSLDALSKNDTEKARIVFQEIANMGLVQRTRGTILKNVICGDSCNILFSKNKNFPNKYLLALLNSKAVNYYFKYFNQTNHVPIGEIKKIPIPSATPNQQQEIITLVDKILATKKSSPQADTTSLEAEIDKKVYALYELTEDEIKIVENSSK